eukprot:754435-Hanusia_phi.AAC.2
MAVTFVGRSCPEGHISCYFENVFSCNVSSGKLYERPKSAEEVDDPPIDEYNIGLSRVFNLRRNPTNFQDESTFWFLSHGFSPWSAYGRLIALAAADYILQPNLRMRNLVKQAKAAVNFRSPVIGVHIRQGDSCHAGTGRKCFKTGQVPGLHRPSIVSAACLSSPSCMLVVSSFSCSSVNVHA